VTLPLSQLNDTIHQRVRLGILAILNESKRADFAFLKDTLEVTDGNLSRHLQVLEEAGYVHIDKTFEARRSRTWVSVTAEGRNAFAEEIAALSRLVERFRGGGDGG
jgi:DNA-binding MarR family transcriptional regulator